MSTLATRKQSEAIREQMQCIRSELPYAMDDARDELKQLADWKYYVRKMPLTSVVVVAAAAYMVVPKSHAVSQQTRGKAEESDVPEKTFVAGLMGSLLAMAVRTGTSMAVRHVSGSFLNARSGMQPHRSAVER